MWQYYHTNKIMYTIMLDILNELNEWNEKLKQELNELNQEGMVIIDKIMELIIKKLKQSHKEITIESCLKKFEEGITKYFNDEDKKFYDKWFKEEGRDMIIAILSSKGIKPKKNSRSLNK